MHAYVMSAPMPGDVCVETGDWYDCEEISDAGHMEIIKDADHVMIRHGSGASVYAPASVVHVHPSQPLVQTEARDALHGSASGRSEVGQTGGRHSRIGDALPGTVMGMKADKGDDTASSDSPASQTTVEQSLASNRSLSHHNGDANVICEDARSGSLANRHDQPIALLRDSTDG